MKCGQDQNHCLSDWLTVSQDIHYYNKKAVQLSTAFLISDCCSDGCYSADCSADFSDYSAGCCSADCSDSGCFGCSDCS